MGLAEFTSLVMALAASFRLSVTSWGRSPARNAAVGGVGDSLHLVWLAVDVVLDDAVQTEAFVHAARRVGLEVQSEADHVHLQVPRAGR